MVSKQFVWCSVVALGLASASAVSAQQTVNLATDVNNREIWRGETAGAQAGFYLDRGELGTGDNRRDLIVGAPGWSSNRGRVYGIFSGPVRRGELSLASADVMFTGGAAGDRFGEATAAGYITAQEIDGTPRDLVVGAPGANGGSGAVYMFARGFTAGQRLAHTDARLTITGAPANARLGATLATGDVDGDGFREIIVGAPGIGAVYIIKGGAGVSGTVNLAVASPAFFVIQGTAAAGVGRSLAAGDLTGDDIYDVAIGAFNEGTIGAVYVLRGRTSNTFPATMAIGAADVKFTGIDIGDFAGFSLEISPFDSDDIEDLVIGAPQGDGPGNSRGDAGEAYVIWGSATIASRSLAAADLTIYGPTAGMGDAWDVAMGDVDRRYPEDLVLTANGPSSAGELHMILGRARSSFPAVWDLATTPMDRRLLGDPASGPLQRTLVWDLTGEGCEDILGANFGNGGGSIYISFSPVLEAILTYPEMSQTTATFRRPFEWTPVQNAEMYRLTLGTRTAGTDLYDSGETTATAVQVPQLPYDRAIFARVYTRIAGAWRTRDSQFFLRAPARFLFPAAGMSGVRSGGTFSWTSTQNAPSYRLQLGSAQGLNDYLDSGDIAATSHRIFSLPPGSTVHARVLTRYDGGYDWTDISFTTAAGGAGSGADSPGRGIGSNFGADPGGDAFLYKPDTGPWSMQLASSAGFDGVNSGLWATGWNIQPGDFNGDGLSDLFLYRPATGQWLRATNIGGGQFSFFGSTWATGWTTTVLDLDGDGRSDVFLYNATTGRWFKCLTVGAGDFNYLTGLWAPGWTIYPAEFNGDGRADLFIYNKNASSDVNSGKWFRVFSLADNGFGYEGGTTKWATDWNVTVADFNGDGTSDLFLYRPTGQWFRVIFVNGAPTFEGGTWAPGWIISKADFNGDELSDLFLYNKTTGRWFQVITERNGTLSYYGSLWAANWEVSITDFNSDGISDMLLYNPANGTWFKATTFGLGVLGYQTGNWGTGWTVIARRTITP